MGTHFRILLRKMLVGKYPKPSENSFTTYNTTQSDFAEVLRKIFQKVFLISYYRKVSEMPNKEMYFLL